MTHRSLFALLTLPLLAGCPEPPPDAPGGAAGSPTCPTGEKPCGDACVPEDIAHGCAADSCEPCYVAEGTAACSADGACTVAACNAGWSQCGGDIGCQTHTDADVSNCGTCGNACNFPHAATECFAGKCYMGACDAGWGSCYDAPPTNGCETHLDSDPQNCGACGNACGAGEVCDSGTCRKPCSVPSECNDDDPCTVDVCGAYTAGGAFYCHHNPASGHNQCGPDLTGWCNDSAGTCCNGCNAAAPGGGYMCVAACPPTSICFDGFCL